jgi:hypothetical protein
VRWAIRRGLAPFYWQAADHDMGVAGIRHFRKAVPLESPFDAVMLSRAWAAAARSVLFFAPDKERTVVRAASDGGTIRVAK